MRLHGCSQYLRFLLLAAPAVLVLWTLGCADAEAPPATNPQLDAPQFNGQVMQAVRDDRPRPTDQYALAIRLQLIPVQVPYGAVSQSERLWSYLDEEAPGVRAAVTLNRNGFRLGRGRLDNWAPVGRLLRQMTGRAFDRQDAVALPGRPLSIVLQADRDVQRIFLYDDRGRLSGRDYPPGDNVLRISCRLNEQDPSSVLCQAAPMIRTARRRPEFVQGPGGGYRMENNPDLLPLEALEFTVEAPQGHFLVLGPAAPAAQSCVAGSRFLVNDQQGLRTETVLVIVPEVFAAPRS